MRSHEEMSDLILSIAKKDERIRCVLMNGSRVNPNVPKDLFQDYDIVYIVTELKSFINQPDWIDYFGERIIIQKPEEGKLIAPSNKGRYSFLMLFQDGNRIDLTLIPIEQVEQYCLEDRLIAPLLDKDQLLPKLSSPTDRDYWIKPPTESLFRDCCNEFWWVSTYVAKGLWRGEILYALKHLDEYVKAMLLQMLDWKVGFETDFSLSSGKCYKYLKNHLTPMEWEAFMATFSDGSHISTWNALFQACDLFRLVAKEVADHFNYHYSVEEDQNVTAYLQHVRNLPHDATSFQ